MVDWNINWYNHYGEQYGGSLKKKRKIEQPFDAVLQILGTYPEKTIIQKVMCTPVFTGALFTAYKTWKQHILSQMEEWIKKMWYQYIVEYYSVLKRNEIMHLQ